MFIKKKNFLNVYKAIKNKVTKKNSKVTKYVDKRQDKTISNNNDYEYIYDSFNELSSKPKKHVKYDKFKNRLATLKNKCFYKNKGHGNENNLQNENCNNDKSSLSMNNTIYNDYNIKAHRRLLDAGGYEVPICQQKHFLSSKNKQDITSIDNTDSQNSEKKRTKKLQTTNLVKPSGVSKNLKASSAIDNQDEKTLNNLQGIVHKRITMFEKIDTLNGFVE